LRLLWAALETIWDVGIKFNDRHDERLANKVALTCGKRKRRFDKQHAAHKGNP
jgi:hypothetical protein